MGKREEWREQEKEKERERSRGRGEDRGERESVISKLQFPHACYTSGNNSSSSPLVCLPCPPPLSVLLYSLIPSRPLLSVRPLFRISTEKKSGKGRDAGLEKWKRAHGKEVCHRCLGRYKGVIEKGWRVPWMGVMVQ